MYELGGQDLNLEWGFTAYFCLFGQTESLILV